MAVDNLAEGVRKRPPVGIEDLPFEVGSMQGVGVAEQHEVIVCRQVLQHRDDVRPQVEEYGLPGSANLVDGGADVALALELGEEGTVGDLAAFEVVQQGALGAVGVLLQKAVGAQFGESLGGGLVVDAIQHTPEVEDEVLQSRPVR